MTDSKNIMQSPVVSQPSTARATQSRSIYGLLLLWLTVLFIAAATCAGGFLLNRKFSGAYTRLDRRQQATERTLADIQSNVQQQHALDTQQTQLAEQLTDLQSRLQALENLSQNSERGHDDWKATEIEQMLTVANEQLKLTGNTSLALFALQSAAVQLAANNSPSALVMRKVIDNDIQVLQTSPFDELAAKLDFTLSQIDTLPLAGEPHTPSTAPISSPLSTKNSANTPQWQIWWNRFSTGVTQQWSNLVQVRRIDHATAQFLTPEQGTLLRENLKLRLLSTRLALLMRNKATFKIDVQAAVHTMHYFDATSPAAQAVHNALLEIEQATEAVTTINIDASLQAVRQYKNRS